MTKQSWEGRIPEGERTYRNYIDGHLGFITGLADPHYGAVMFLVTADDFRNIAYGNALVLFDEALRAEVFTGRLNGTMRAIQELAKCAKALRFDTRPANRSNPYKAGPYD